MWKRIHKFLVFLIGIVGTIAAVSDQMEQWKDKKRFPENRHVPFGFYEQFVKRPLDCIVSMLALIVLSPVIAVVAIFVRIKLGTPVIFTQERPGKNEQIFKLYKFRTMTNERGADGELLPDDNRLTVFGKWLRASSLDELPELWNIFKGDMSLIGPRPLLVEYLPRYNDRQRHRHDVRQGLTGLAQANGRNSLSWEEKFEDDVNYVDKITFLGDVKIIIKTIGIVLQRTGISSETSETMETFMGSGEEEKGD